MYRGVCLLLPPLLTGVGKVQLKGQKGQVAARLYKQEFVGTSARSLVCLWGGCFCARAGVQR